jgi:hypothetical protein
MVACAVSNRSDDPPLHVRFSAYGQLESHSPIRLPIGSSSKTSWFLR